MNSKYEHFTEYTSVMYYFKSLLRNGVISKNEYNKIDTNIAKKYGISLSSIFRDYT